jgi:hypothetical protein
VSKNPKIEIDIYAAERIAHYCIKHTCDKCKFSTGKNGGCFLAGLLADIAYKFPDSWTNLKGE